MKTLLKNAFIINPDCSSQSDILIEDNKIIEVSENIECKEKYKHINVTDKFVLPGGIDPHVHMHLPTVDGFSSDDFKSGSIAALFGGTTTILDFVTPNKHQLLIDALQIRKKEAGSSFADYSFHVSPVDWHDGIENEIAQCFDLGITSFKVYLAYLNTIGLKEEVFAKVLKTVGKLGGIVTIHCETGKEIEEISNDFYNNGYTQPYFHPLSRPPETEAKAVKNAIELADKNECPIYIVHVSCKESLQFIEKAKKAGQAVFAETCPQYLLLNDEKYQGTFEETSGFVMSPPLRKKDDNEALWEALNSGVIDTVGTDHCPFTMNQKFKGRNDFRKIPNGAGGVEHRLELLYTFGVLTGKISLNKWVELCCSKPAEVFGLQSKGKIEVGMDADIVIWNPDSESIISAKNHHQNCDINIYEGFKTRGNAEIVIKNGEIITEGGKIKIDLENGRFLNRIVVKYGNKEI